MVISSLLNDGPVGSCCRPISAPDQLQSASSLGLDVGGERFYDPLQIASQVPPELVRLTDLLRHDAWLATPGLFVKAFDLATATAAAAAVGTGPAAGAAGAATSAAAARRPSRSSSSAGAGGHLIARANSLDPVAEAASMAGSPRALGRLSSFGSPRHRHGPSHGAADLLRFGSGSGRSSSPAWDGGSGSDSPHHQQQQQQREERPASPLGSPPALHRQQALLAVRRALDGGRPFPEGIDAHDAAAALLAFFADLPQPLMPQEVAQVCDVYSPPVSCLLLVLLHSNNQSPGDRL